MFGRSEDIFEEEKPKENKLTREEKKLERLQEKERKRQEKDDLAQQKAAFEEEQLNRKLELKQQKQIEKEDALNAKLAQKATKKIEKVEKKSQKKKKSVLSIFLIIVLCILCLASGFAAAFGMCYFRQIPFSLLLAWPFIIAVDVFFFSTAAFFSTDGKTEVVYGMFSLLALACCIFQMAVIFR